MNKDLKIIEEVISYVKGSLYVLDRVKNLKSSVAKTNISEGVYELRTALVCLEEAYLNLQNEQDKQRKELEETEETLNG